MRVQVLYVAECPSHPAAMKLLREVLAAEGVTTDIREVLVSDQRMAGELKFVGSPTIRINGKDVAGDSPIARDFAISCRLYPGSPQIGLPPAEKVQSAVQEAQRADHVFDSACEFG